MTFFIATPIIMVMKVLYSAPQVTEELSELEELLWTAEQALAVADETAQVFRAQVREVGNVHHRPGCRRSKAYTYLDSFGEESELGYEQLIERRFEAIAVYDGLKVEVATLKAELKAERVALNAAMRTEAA